MTGIVNPLDILPVLMLALAIVLIPLINESPPRR
jgi:hypothetical protein